MYEDLKLNSSIGRKYILNQELITDEFILKVELGNLSAMYDFVINDQNAITLTKVCDLLKQINDIHSTINNLHSRRILDDIELFEVKKFGILSQKITDELNYAGFDILLFHDLNNIIDILDPEQTRIPSFYIYSGYDERLAELRKIQDNLHDEEPFEIERVRLKCIEIEDEVREKLSHKLSKFSVELQKNLNNLGYLDVLIAKSVQAKEMTLCKPEISHDNIEFKGIFNPQIKHILNSRSKKYQPVDINLYNSPSLITGSNMSGKTVLLKTVVLAQYLFQFGFYIPAISAKMNIFDGIMFNIGDDQSELNGLSSFAVEMLKVNEIITTVKKGKNILVLVDELARTTNPEEGKALVSAFLEIMNEYNVCSIVTTHYGGVLSGARRLRVKGLILNDKEKVTVDNINDFMDYSLIEVTDDRVPAEAVRITEILGVDEEFIQKTKEFLKNQ
jgi:DNA mismatch repair ATPase MutS